ncbi:MAG: J domain-containing protein, partial [Pseudomonadota bacterium]|nr:J domain-containing protein [Pseudomonadota bacterium]
ENEAYSSCKPPADSPEARAFRILGLDPSASLSELKARYKELVKTHHPDRNGGDKVAEERLKDINDAYSTLRKTVTV